MEAFLAFVVEEERLSVVGRCELFLLINWEPGFYFKRVVYERSVFYHSSLVDAVENEDYVGVAA